VLRCMVLFGSSWQQRMRAGEWIVCLVGWLVGWLCLGVVLNIVRHMMRQREALTSVFVCFASAAGPVCRTTWYQVPWYQARAMIPYVQLYELVQLY
jgi:hypothetical protein